MPNGRLHLAYIATGYPYVSHTFIQSEVGALRELGVRIDTFAIRRAPESECRTQSDREAYATTYALRPPRAGHYLQAHLRALLSSPSRYFDTLVQASRLGDGSLSALVHQLAYFAQAVVLWDRSTAVGVRHIHAHFANVSSDLAWIAAMLGGGELTWSFTMHGPTEFKDVRHFHLAEKARNADAVICISDFARSQLMALVGPEHWPKLRLVHCGVDIERFAPSRGDFDDGSVRIACVGRLVPEKGQRLLIEALAGLRREGADVSVVFAGDGPERTSLASLAAELNISDRVEFLGAIAHGAVDELLRDSSIFCLPSLAEGVPIVLMEAMAMELPVVASRVMGIPELIDDGVSGRLIAPGSVSDLTAVLSELLIDAAQRRRLGEGARRRVASEFELRMNAARLRAVYEELLVAPS